jgi:OOP family OmpA-OmpF porin
MKMTKIIKLLTLTIILSVTVFSAYLTAEDNIKEERKALHTMESFDADKDGINDHLDWCPNTPAAAAVDNEGCPIDSDGDGVYDFRDKCPGSKCIAVDNEGCPIDSDGDGVTDFLDSCGDTPQGTAVDKKGCPRDGDGDGVYDEIDECPDTPRGDVVDEKGCTILTDVKDVIELNVEFDFDKANIKSVYSEHLAAIADFLRKYPDTLAIIEGHTDSKGSDVYNMGLSLRRAESVRSYLINNYGISPLQLKATGYGESRPVADNATDEGRQRNRRTVAVLATIIEKPVKKGE